MSNSAPISAQMPAVKRALGAAKAGQTAWVVFSGQADLPMLRLLKPGFRHCFLLMHDGHVWLTVDPMLHCAEIAVHHDLDSDFDFPSHLEEQGYRVIAAPILRAPQKPAPLSVLSCVEVIKRYLGIHKRFVFTPWQLFCFLQRHAYSNTYCNPQ